MLQKVRTISKQCKAQARFSILGHLGTCVGVNLLYFIISYSLSSLISSVIPVTGIVSFFMEEFGTWIVLSLTGIFHYGLCSFYMNLQYKKPAGRHDLFLGLRENTDKILIVEAVLSGIQTLSLLPARIIAFEIPNINDYVFYAIYIAGFAISFYFQLRYALSYYLLLDYPQSSARDVLRISALRMKGHKRELFYIICSILPLYALSILSLGIGALWISAYEYAIFAAFYRRILQNK